MCAPGAQLHRESWVEVLPRSAAFVSAKATQGFPDWASMKPLPLGGSAPGHHTPPWEYGDSTSPKLPTARVVARGFCPGTDPTCTGGQGWVAQPGQAPGDLWGKRLHCVAELGLLVTAPEPPVTTMAVVPKLARQGNDPTRGSVPSPQCKGLKLLAEQASSLLSTRALGVVGGFTREALRARPRNAETTAKRRETDKGCDTLKTPL